MKTAPNQSGTTDRLTIERVRRALPVVHALGALRAVLDREDIAGAARDRDLGRGVHVTDKVLVELAE